MILTEAQRLVQDSARHFAEAEIRPYVRDWERDGKVPREVLRKMGQLGLMGMLVPQALGGSGADFVSYVLATEEIAAVDCGLCNMMNVNNSPIGAAIRDHGTPLQHETFLRPLAQGTLQGAFLLTEPQAGSDASALTTQATRQGDRYILNGTKQFVTAGQTAEGSYDPLRH